MNGTPENNIPQGKQRDPRFRERKLTAKERSVTGRRVVNFGLAGFFLILVLYTLYLIFTKLQTWGIYNADIAGELAFRKECWEQGTLWPKGFVAGAESLVRGAVIPYLLFYFFTRNPVFSYQLEAMTSLALVLSSLLYLLRKLRLSGNARLLALCMFLTVLPCGITQMLPVDSGNFIIFPYLGYGPFAAAIFLALALRISVRDGLTLGNRRRFLCNFFLLVFLASCIGFTTIKLAMNLFIPLFCVDFIRVLVSFIKEKKIEKSCLIMLICSGITLVVYVISYSCFLMMFGDTITPESYMIRDVSSWLNWDILSSNIACILNSLGFSGSGSLASVSGVRFLLSCCVVAIEVFAIIWLLRKKDCDENFHEKSISFYWIATTMVMFIIFVCGGWINWGGQRGYFPVSIILPVLCGIAMNDWTNVEDRKVNWPYIGVSLCLIAFWGTTFILNHDTYSEKYPDADIVAAADYIQDEGYEYVVASFDYAGRIYNYTNGAVDRVHSLGDNIATLTPFNWVIDKNKFVDKQEGMPCIYMVSDSEEQRVFTDASYVSWMLNDYAVKVAEFGPYNLYAMNENPYTLAAEVKEEHTGGLPKLGVDAKTDYPDYFGFAYEHATINDVGEAVSDGLSDGFTVFGPFSETIPGVYNITLHYVIESDEKNKGGIFDVALDTQPIQRVEIEPDQVEAVLTNVKIDEFGHSFEVRTWVPEGVIIRVQSIDYERVG